METAEEATGPYNAVELGGCSRLGLHACRQSSRRGAWKWLYHKSPRSLATLSARKHRRTRRFAGVRGRDERIRILLVQRRIRSELGPGHLNGRERFNRAPRRPVNLRAGSASRCRLRSLAGAVGTRRVERAAGIRVGASTCATLMSLRDNISSPRRIGAERSSKLCACTHRPAESTCGGLTQKA